VVPVFYSGASAVVFLTADVPLLVKQYFEVLADEFGDVLVEDKFELVEFA
jgi:hypothetical protein